MSERPAHYRLQVTRGEQAGAGFTLHAGQRVRVGYGYDCDVVLRRPPGAPDVAPEGDTAPDDTILDIVIDDEGTVQMAPRIGDAMLDDLPLAGQQSVHWLPGTELHWPGIALVLYRGDHTASHADSTDVTDATDTTAYPALPVEASEARPRSAGMRISGAVAVVFLLLAASAFWFEYTRSPQSLHTDPGDDIAAVRAVLESLGADDVTVTVSDTRAAGGIVVAGLFDSREALRDAHRALDPLGLVSEWRVGSLDVLGEEVQSVFQLHGIEASIRSLGDARFAVDTATANDSALQQAYEAALNDLPALQALELDNTPPAPEPSADPVATLPGKRIVMVVASEPVHLLTEDGTRYFRGAMLPSGHRVRDIDGQTVHLELGERVVELQF